MRVVLVTPPFLALTGPAAAPALLTGVLRQEGHEAITFDINRFCCERLFTENAIRRSLERFPWGNEPSLLTGDMRENLPRFIDASVQVLRAEDSYSDIRLYRQALFDIEQAMRCHARAHGRSRWSSVEFAGNFEPTDPHDLMAAVRRGQEIFDPALNDAVRALFDARPDMVAISVSVPGQLYGALRLAFLIHEHTSAVHVCLGGATVTRLRRAYQHLPELFDIVDSIILREGERPIVALAHALNTGIEPLHCVEGLLVRRDGCVVPSEGTDNGVVRFGATNRRGGAFSLNRMPFPVFEDLMPQGKYLAPRPLLPLSTTRNCYYDKCEFCAIGRSFNQGYDEMPARRMVEQINHLRQQFPLALFKDVSEALPPRLILECADLFAEQGDPPPWESYLRFESAFASPDAARRLRGGGLRVAYLGLETASATLVDEMKKHINIDQAEQTIRQFAEADIWVHLFLLSGYARENEADHEATLDFVRRNARFIRSIQAAPFVMELDSNIVDLAARYRFIPKVRREPSFALTIDIDSFGDIPPHSVARRRVNEIRQVAYEECRTPLATSRHLWDGHKLFFQMQNSSLARQWPKYDQQIENDSIEATSAINNREVLHL